MLKELWTTILWKMTSSFFHEVPSFIRLRLMLTKTKPFSAVVGKYHMVTLIDYSTFDSFFPLMPSSFASGPNSPSSTRPPRPWVRCFPPPGIGPASRSGSPWVSSPRATAWLPRCSCTAWPSTCCSSARRGQTASSASWG